METEASLKELIDLWKFHEADFLENLRNFDDRKAAMKLICSRMTVIWLRQVQWLY